MVRELMVRKLMVRELMVRELMVREFVVWELMVWELMVRKLVVREQLVLTSAQILSCEGARQTWRAPFFVPGSCAIAASPAASGSGLCRDPQGVRFEHQCIARS